MTPSASEAHATPASVFADFDLHSDLHKTIAEAGFETPTPIQAAAIPSALQGRDLIGLAQTGTGKTAAFVLPLLQRLMATPRKGVRALVIAPTRELVDQIHDVIKTLARGTGIRSTAIYGGVSYGRQLDELRRQPQIIVACPGRLLDHLDSRAIDLSKIEALVLDEADRMFDMGFLPTIRKIVRVLPKDRQTLLFSATMPPEIEQLARELLRSPEIIRVKSNLPVAKITHGVYTVGEGSKQALLNQWLGENEESLVVVFTRMKHTAKRIHQRLEANGHRATSLHGNLSQGRRQQALGGFRNGQYRILVATDIAARGIDVEGVSHVINYDMPENLESYIHRVGRAGRASRSGAAVSFITKEDRTLQRSIERWLQGPMDHLGAIESSDESSSTREFRPRPTRGNQGRRGDNRSQPRRDSGNRGSSNFRDSAGPRENSRERSYNGNRSFNGNREIGSQRDSDTRRSSDSGRNFDSSRGFDAHRGNDQRRQDSRRSSDTRYGDSQGRSDSPRSYEGSRNSMGPRTSTGQGRRQFTGRRPARTQG